MKLLLHDCQASGVQDGYVVLREARKSGWKWVLDGMAPKMPVTIRSYVLSTLSRLPIGFSEPKYLRAISSVITTELGLASTVAGSPCLSGNAKNEKKFESAQKILTSWNCCWSERMSDQGPLPDRRMVWMPGNSVRSAPTSGRGVNGKCSGAPWVNSREKR